MSATLPSTQHYLPLAEVRNDTVVLNNGSLRAVLLASSINFSLKSEEEQNALIASYAGFLNTLDFPIQIVIQSRQLNIDEYLHRLQSAQQQQTSDLLRAQIADYRDFVSELIKLADIMAKRFYVVIPYDPISDHNKGFVARVKELFAPGTVIKLEEKKFLERREELNRRVSHVQQGLLSMGINAAQLNTEQVIEVLYSTYNPAESLSARLGSLEQIQVE